MYILKLNLQTTCEGNMGLLYISKCGLENSWGPPGELDEGLFMLICIDICRKKSRTVILGRRRSRVYNVVTVQCILSIILNIHRQAWCSVGRNPKNAIGSSLVVKQRNDLFKFRLQDRDIYFEIKYSTKMSGQTSELVAQDKAEPSRL